PLQRFRADDLLSAVFPVLTACPDNGTVPADIPLPDHPLVNQTIDDALHEATDLEGLIDLLKEIEAGKIAVTCVDTREPTPFSYQLLNAQPYAFLDDAPLEERRARAVATRRTLSVESLRDLGRLDPEAIEKVRREAWPLVRDADELHDTLLSVGLLPEEEARPTGVGCRVKVVGENREIPNLYSPDGEESQGEEKPWTRWFNNLIKSGRAARAHDRDGRIFWTTAERWPMVRAAKPDLVMQPEIPIPEGTRFDWTAAEGWVALVRGRMEIVGPTTVSEISRSLGLEENQVEAALHALEGEGYVLRGRFTHDVLDENETQWCARRLLARIHRLTLDSLRRQMAPISSERLVRFLLGWSRLSPERAASGREGTLGVIEQLQGFEIPAGAWERDILPHRIRKYDSRWLDDLCLSGEVVWGRVRRRPSRGASKILPVSLMLREDLDLFRSDGDAAEGQTDGQAEDLGGDARLVLSTLSRYGALFFNEIVSQTRLLPTQVEGALWELVASGRVSGDGFASIRSLTLPVRKEAEMLRRRLKRRGRAVHASRPGNGRWWLMREEKGEGSPSHEETVDFWARQLLERYGVMFRDLLAREDAAPFWKELLPVYRRMESRGEIRGGRFITGVGGEQFALPEAVDLLRGAREETEQEGLIVISAADPMNLVGIVTPGPKVAATASNAVAYLGGKHVGHRQGGEVWVDPKIDTSIARRLERMLRTGRTREEDTEDTMEETKEDKREGLLF
ncbi:MAG TPA: hypothetical protein VFG95_06620, partial [Nitrospiria bacterium]|nr:hypothetical protein [Nitrospiria bacterium]